MSPLRDACATCDNWMKHGEAQPQEGPEELHTGDCQQDELIQLNAGSITTWASFSCCKFVPLTRPPQEKRHPAAEGQTFCGVLSQDEKQTCLKPRGHADAHGDGQLAFAPSAAAGYHCNVAREACSDSRCVDHYGATALPAPRPPQENEAQRKFERSQQRWGNLKKRIEAEIVSFTNPCLSTQQRHQYQNGVARLRWVLDEMRKSPDVLAEAVPAAAPPPVPAERLALIEELQDFHRRAKDIYHGLMFDPDIAPESMRIEALKVTRDAMDRLITDVSQKWARL